MINIGPWWLYDLIAMAIIVGCLIFGMSRGFFIVFYILLLQIINIIILMFVPAILANSLNPHMMGFWTKIGLVSIFDSIGNLIGSSLDGILGAGTENGGFPSIDGSGASYEMLKTVSALFLYLFFTVVIFLLINLIGWILYKGFKTKIRKLKVIRSIDVLLGAFNGLVLGMALSLIISFLAGFPIFATDHQKFGYYDMSEKTEEEWKDYLQKGNSYKQYALSNKIAGTLPTIPIFSFTYTNACVDKYILKPVILMYSEALSNKESSAFSSIFYIYEDILVEGYSTDNPLKAPVAACVEIMPKDTRSMFRLASELMLMGSKIFGDKNQAYTPIHSIELINRLDEFYFTQVNPIQDNNQKFVETNNKYDGKDGWLTKQQLVNYYNWEKQQKEEDPNKEEKNPFILLSDHIESINKDRERELVKVLRDPEATYKFFKNIYYVNMNSRSNLDTLPFLPAVYSSNQLFRGMELVPSGELKLGKFDTDPSKSNVTLSDIKYNQNKFWKEYNVTGFFWMGYYFDYAYEQVKG